MDEDTLPDLAGSEYSEEEYDEAVPSESGYTTGFTTGDEDDDEPGDIFDTYMDPLQLLQQMEQGTGDVDVEEQEVQGSHPGLQPYQIFRTHRALMRRRRKGGSEPVWEDDIDGDKGGGSSKATYKKSGSKKDSQTSIQTSAEGKVASSGTAAAFGADLEDILKDPLAAKLGFAPERRTRRRRRKRKAKAGVGSNKRQLPEHVSKMLGEANLMYATRRYKEAIEVLMEVIKECPNHADPFHTLGLVHEADGDIRRSLDFYMIAAHLTPKDTILWKRLASLSTELGFYRQAIYCLTKAINRSKQDLDARWDRAILYAEVNEMTKAISHFKQIGELRRGDVEVPKMVARLHHRMGQPHKAMEVLEKHMQDYPDSTDLTHINILAELYMEAGHFGQTYTLIQRAEQLLLQSSASCGDADTPLVASLPLDLSVKAGLCLSHLGRPEDAESYLQSLLNEPADQFSDLHLDVGNAFIAMGQHEQALLFLKRLEEVPDYLEPALWERLLLCYRALHRPEAALDMYLRKASLLSSDDPRYLEVCLSLAELYAETGQNLEAKAMLYHIEGLHQGPSRQDALGQQEVDMMEYHIQIGHTIGSGAASAMTGMPEVEHALPSSAAGLGNAALSTVQAESGLPNQRVSDVDQFLRQSQLSLKLGERSTFVASLLPVMTESLSLLESDIMALKDPSLPPEVLKAVVRRQFLLSKGGRKGEGAQETESVFKGAFRRERRSIKTLEADRKAEEYLSSLSAKSSTAPWSTSLTRALMSQEEYLMVFIQLNQALIEGGQGQEAATLLSKAHDLCGQQNKLFPRSFRDRLVILLVDAMSSTGQYGPAMALLRGLCVRWPASVAAWSRYCRVSAKAGTVRSWAVHVSTMRRRCPSSLPVMMMQGHVHSMYRMYTEALMEYFHAYRYWAQEPLLSLCIAIAYLNLATTKKVPDRNRAVLNGFAFMQEYIALRAGERHVLKSDSGNAQQAIVDHDSMGSSRQQEAFYNMGRAAHQLGLSHVALQYYQKALEIIVKDEPSLAQQHTNRSNIDSSSTFSSQDSKMASDGSLGSKVCLKYETAHNLAMIYLNSGSTELAREMYRNHVVI
ncbi:hypothetical protein CEUSTIGMA_g2003.t1 [Chlamydomonas eustigma]|uniref:Uncharacterized protein n=1 Tax=Chlamydomonas eustigma TaxID=1157962 RepID=A0A250WUN8_9CHLO|nr:hypothetical protein CEUSTIGMA_g2003.t1 [Chlamydomonas eustigma]|eukprot:GAX74553.1 hypothetical protein CEUSTIGMA_g2003.t1 [Chlamydomonas eustigma]